MQKWWSLICKFVCKFVGVSRRRVVSDLISRLVELNLNLWSKKYIPRPVNLVGSWMDEAVTAGDGGSSSDASSEPSSFLPYNLPLISAFLAFALAQFLKLFTTWYKEKRWDSKRVIDSGGMPSSHSATVMALAVAIGFQDGTGDPAFAIAVVLACIVMYDASGIRHHAGRQAELLNQIVCEFPPEHPLAAIRPLRELLGHTPLQVVAGAVLGCIVAYFMRSTN